MRGACGTSSSPKAANEPRPRAAPLDAHGLRRPPRLGGVFYPTLRPASVQHHRPRLSPDRRGRILDTLGSVAERRGGLLRAAGWLCLVLGCLRSPLASYGRPERSEDKL